MITLTDPEERISALEDAVFNDLYPGVDAMNWGIGQVYQETQANREEIAGLRVDIAALETSVHADLAALKANVTMQVSGLRREIATTRSALRSEMTTFKSAVDRRFGSVDSRFGAMDRRFDELAGKLDEFMREMRGGRA